MACRRPCTECPWRRDTPAGQFPPERYEALSGTTGEPGREAPFGAPWFACHKAPEGEEFHCAGWLAAVGLTHLGVRLKAAFDPEVAAALRPGDDWPELYESYEELLATHGG
jgi:hypothetical protein